MKVGDRVESRWSYKRGHIVKFINPHVVMIKYDGSDHATEITTFKLKVLSLEEIIHEKEQELEALKKELKTQIKVGDKVFVEDERSSLNCVIGTVVEIGTFGAVVRYEYSNVKLDTLRKLES